MLKLIGDLQGGRVSAAASLVEMRLAKCQVVHEEIANHPISNRNKEPAVKFTENQLR